MDAAIFYVDNNHFSTFGAQHITTILVFIWGGIFWISSAQKQDKEIQEQWALRFSRILAFTVLAWIFLRVCFGLFNEKTDLPFDLCNISALLMPFFIKNRKNWLFQVFYFWIMAGTTQAILTPHLYDGFPHYTFIKYFLVHCGLVILILYVIFVFKMRPTLKGIGIAFGAIQVYMILLIIVNKLLGANYAYICHKPDTPSLLDYFGPHPYYLLVSQAMALLFFFLYWLPFSRIRERG